MNRLTHLMGEQDSNAKAVRWIVWFCWLLAIMNFGMAIGSLWLILSFNSHVSALFPELEPNTPELASLEQISKLVLGLTLASGVAFGILNIVLSFWRRGATAYTVHLVNIVASLASPFCIPIAIPLLIAWLKPDVKRHFGA